MSELPLASRPVVRLRPQAGAAGAAARALGLCRRGRARPADAGDPGRGGGGAAGRRAPAAGVRGVQRRARRSRCGCSTPIRRRRSTRAGSRRGCARALALRETLYDAPFYRLVHAEADGLPGVVIDRFGEAAVVQPNAAWADARLPALVAALQAVTGVATVVKNAGGRTRGLEGLDDDSAVLAGALDGPVAVPMNGAVYFADLAEGQKTGLFYDQRPNHAFAARLARGRSVLDVFAHVGGFALAALAAGATSGARGGRLGGRRWSWRRGGRRRAGSAAARCGGRRLRRDGGAGGGGAALRRGGLRPAGLRAEQGGAGGGAARLRAGGAARRRRWSSRTGSWCSARAATRPISRASARRACAGWRGRGGRRRSCTWAGRGRTIRCIPALAETAYLKALFLRLGP